MPLTRENMLSTASRFDSGAFMRDIARMDQPQLDKFVRNSFTGNPDPGWPHYFFEEYFSVNAYGSGERYQSPSPAAFLANMHDIVGKVALGIYSVGGEIDLKVRPRFRKVVNSLLDESLAVKVNPMEDQQRIARFSVESTGTIESSDSFIENAEKIAQDRKIDLHYPPDLIHDLNELSWDRPAMLRKANALIQSGRFGDLKLSY